ncbi:response regulator transcription factor [Shewanella litorisediminis]|uniref:Response regulator transcription factor n=1 Tax=Shewanella litorisediminis TaxID=1173586 RepID=A0ABX7G026_9GAMM|nr:response regulator [Shewanella litorisediminis]MCL2918261.1 response regulator [Shewanella litorisediminis]QRH00690.1 response regulator transcription factor [Shewanella litorisediminis]
MIDVYLVDDDPDVLASLKWMLEGLGIRAQGFASAQDFLAAVDFSRPAVAVLDVQMPDMDGMSLLEVLFSRPSPIVPLMLTGHGNISMAVKAIQQGAMDFIEKPVDGDKLLALLRRAATLATERAISLQQSAEIQQRLDSLSPRETDVMHRVLEGKLNKTIAAELFITQRTVEIHRRNLLEKMAASNVAELAFVLSKLRLPR